MADKITELEKIIAEQSKQIKKLIASAIVSEKRMMALDKKIARVNHTTRNHTNSLNTIMRTLHKGGS